MTQNVTLCSPRPSSGLDPNTPVIVESARPQNIPKNHVLLRVDRFGFSANNTTYQALGEVPHYRYFEFNYPPTVGEVSKKTHGLIPVWGFADVLESTHPDIKAGERVYGYLAPTRYLLLPVAEKDFNKHYFYVPRPHLPADRRPYNQLTRCATDLQYNSDPALEDMTMLYRPLFWTSYWCEDWLYASNYRNGATRVLIASASSKTAFTLAHCIQRRRQKGQLGKNTRIIGLTSPRNVAFTKGLGLYDEVLTYDDVEKLKHEDQKWIYVDVAGVDKLNERVFTHFAPTRSLVAGIILGMSTVDPANVYSVAKVQSEVNTFASTASRTAALTKSDMEVFFMVEWLARRRMELSIREIVSMQKEAWDALLREGRHWVHLERVYGGSAVKKAYARLNKGEVGPDTGFIWSMWDTQEKAKL